MRFNVVSFSRPRSTTGAGGKEGHNEGTPLPAVAGLALSGQKSDIWGEGQAHGNDGCARKRRWNQDRHSRGSDECSAPGSSHVRRSSFSMGRHYRLVWRYKLQLLAGGKTTNRMGAANPKVGRARCYAAAADRRALAALLQRYPSLCEILWRLIQRSVLPAGSRAA